MEEVAIALLAGALLSARPEPSVRRCLLGLLGWCLWASFDLPLIGVHFLTACRTLAMHWEDSQCWVNRTQLAMASCKAVRLPRMAPRTVMVGHLWYLGRALLVPTQLACSILAEQLATCGLRLGRRVEGKDVESEQL
jgi:hypothetical protein